jgi:hypothetical protein
MIPHPHDGSASFALKHGRSPCSFDPMRVVPGVSRAWDAEVGFFPVH